MTRPRIPVRRAATGWLLSAAVAALVAGCGSSSSSAGTTAKGSGGTASVACAGSLDKLYNTVLGPAFAKATGDHFGGPPCAGSLDLAQEIMSKAISPGVFLAIGAKPIESLYPSRAHFAISLATDPLVIAYSPKSRYAAQLDAIASGSKSLASLFTLMETPGFRLGRTDPTQDPQGEFFIVMMMLAQSQLHLPMGQADKILGITSGSPFGTSSQQLDEDALPVDEQTGEVDAGSSYLSEALQYGLKYIKLPADLNFSDPTDLATYATVHITVAGDVFMGKLITLNTTIVLPAAGTDVIAKDASADNAFLSYLLAPAGRAVLAKAGYTLDVPTIGLAPGTSTPADALPPSVLSAFDSDHGTVAT